MSGESTNGKRPLGRLSPLDSHDLGVILDIRWRADLADGTKRFLILISSVRQVVLEAPGHMA